MNEMRRLMSIGILIVAVLTGTVSLHAQIGTYGGCFGPGSLGGVIGQHFAEMLARQAQWDRDNRDWFMRNGFDASIGRNNHEWLDYQLQPMRAPGFVDLPSVKTYYELGNQVPFTLRMGPATLHFRGAVVRMYEGFKIKRFEDEFGNGHTQCDAPFNWLHAHSGWATDYMSDPSIAVEGFDPNGFYKTAWMKGYLTRSAVRTHVHDFADTCGRVWARYVYRYQYHAPDGTVVAFYERPREIPRTSNFSGGCGSGALPAQEPSWFFSSDGNATLDVSNKCRPVIRWADGSTEEFHRATTHPVFDVGPISVAPPYEPSCSAADMTADLRRTDRNGNITVFRYSTTPEGLTVQTMTDAQGRQTVVTADTNGLGMQRLRSVELPSIGTAPPLRYTVNWRSLEVRFDQIWPDVTCTPENGTPPGCGSPISVDVVDNVVVPDGRSYVFGYGPWGNLTRVTEPGGAVREFVYGDGTNMAYANAVVPLVNRIQSADLCGAMWSGESIKMQARGLVRERVLPDGVGIGRPAFEKRRNFTLRKLTVPGCQFDGIGAASAGPAGCSQVWAESTEPDGTVTKQGSVVRAVPGFIPNDDRLAVPPTVPGEVHGLSLGQETWSGANLVASHYNGDKDTGQLWYESEFVKLVRMPFAIPAGMRATKARSSVDGLTTTTNFVHGHFIDIDPGAAVERRTTAVTSICVFAGAVNENGCSGTAATPLVRTEMSYLNQFETFFAANILNLTTAKRVYGPGSSTPVVENTFAYDEFPLTASGRPASVLEARGAVPRGNLTTSTERVSPTKTISTKTRYFDTGSTQSVTDPKGFVTTYAPSFALCSASSPNLTSTITNTLGHTNTTLADCFSELTLRSTDANGRSTYTQYDYLGRPVESASPGDVLTALPLTGAQPFTRDPSAPTGAGSQVGQAMVTAWSEYLAQGVYGAQRVVEHTRDGSPGGRYKKIFSDGLGRVVQTRVETDPSKSGGLGEIVDTTVYDSMGRISSTLSPCFAAASDVRTAHCGTAGVVTAFDALGRPVTVTAPGSRVTTHTYGQENGRWLQTTTNPRGYKTKTFTDLLGRTVQVDRQSDRCAGGYCSHKATFDVAGRVLTQSDPNGNTITYGYDGLGRRTSMLDPDLGSWSYEYDDNSNMTAQVDARGQRIVLSYDNLNRLTLKDLPPAGPSVEDVSFYYDGTGPVPPADHPVPSITTFTPALVEAGSPGFTLTVNGGNFVQGALVRVNGQNRQTTFVTSAQLQAVILAADVQNSGALSITVLNPPPGGGSSAAASFTVNGRPVVTLTSPTNGQVLSPAPVTIALRSTVTDDTGGATVTYFNGTTAIGSSSTGPAYAFDWTNVAAGTYSLRANVTDLHGSVASSATISVTVAAGPAVSITAPANGQSFNRPVNITIAANASSSLGISKVQFFRSGTLLGEDTTAPYSFVWMSAELGTWVLTAKAFDTHGNATVSTGVSVVVGDRPSVTLVRPAANAVFFAPAAILIEAGASDTDGIRQVEFYQGTTRLVIDTVFPYRFDWTNVPIGSYRLTAIAIDNSGASTTSAPVDIQVRNAPPAVSITAPRNGDLVGVAPAAISIDVTASDLDGITKVEFFAGATKLGEDPTSPYRFVWTNVPAGSHTLTAVAHDGAAITNTSAAVTVTVSTAAGVGGDNAVTSFSTTTNPAGRWSYGHRAPGGPFTLYTVKSTPYGAGANAWRVNTTDCCPQILNNNTGAAYTYVGAPSVVHPADVLNVHPGPSDQRGVLRWTAEVSGLYQILGRFEGIDTVGTTTDAQIHHNGLAIFSGNVTGYGNVLPFALTRALNAGDTVEISVGDGPNTYSNDSTGVAVTIAPHADDAVLSFSPSANPSGRWSYGYEPAGGTFTAFTVASSPHGTGSSAWRAGTDCCPQVVANTTKATYTYPNATSVVHPPDLLNLHPGPSDSRSVVRWTSPASGTYRISGRFEGIDNVGTSTDVRIKHRTTVLFSANLNGFGTRVPFHFSHYLAVGESIEFSVGDGTNNTYNNDSTGLALSILPGSAHDAVANFSGAVNPSGPWTYGYITVSTGVFTKHTLKNTFHGPGINMWAYTGSFCCAMVGGNNTRTTYAATTGSFVQPPHVLSMLPYNNLHSVVRWTAPAAGTYAIAGWYEALARWNLPVNGSILHGGVTLWSADVAAQGVRVPFLLKRTVAAGEIIEFRVSQTSSANMGSDAAGLAVTIDPTVP